VTVLVDAATRPRPEVVGFVARALREGEAVVVPTETVYGLAALPSVPGATDRLFALKGRGAHVPVAVLCADTDQGLALADAPGPAVRELAARHWPGPLTLVLRRRPDLGWELGEPRTTIGVRCPDHPLVQAVAREVGPIATTSANRHGEPTPPDGAAVAGVFGEGVAVVVDGGRCTGTPSTVLDVTGDDWKVLRQGAISVTAAARRRG
jgi:L-threonylcarbamoyladenylate synthase